MDCTRRTRTPWTALPPLLSLTLLCSCSGGHSGNDATSAAALNITTTKLPNGQVGRAYSFSLSAHGGATPLTWSVTGGTLPAGLTLAAGSGLVSGTPTATANGAPLTFKVTDAGSPPQTRSATLKLNISPAAITVSVSPARAGITIKQTLTLGVNTNDY